MKSCMKNLFGQIFVALILAGVVSFSWAEIKSDTTLSRKFFVPMVKQWEREIVDPYMVARTYVFDADTRTPYRPNTAGGHENSMFSWRLNQTRFFSAVSSYVPDNDPIEGCEKYRGDDINWEGPDCYWINKRHKVCHLFMMTEQGQIAGIGRIQIGRDKKLIQGKPFCYDIKAMTAPKEITDAMLITLSYIDSAAQADPRNAPDEFPMTVLMRFKQEPDGKLTITQDEQCLPNPNRIASIADARKALKASGCR